jgi:hypothetical protein
VKATHTFVRKKLLATAAVVALFLTTGTANAMQHDMSNTWCAKNIPKRAMVDREHYYAWIEKCHARRGTKPRWGLPPLDAVMGPAPSER